MLRTISHLFLLGLIVLAGCYDRSYAIRGKIMNGNDNFIDNCKFILIEKPTKNKTITRELYNFENDIKGAFLVMAMNSVPSPADMYLQINCGAPYQVFTSEDFMHCDIKDTGKIEFGVIYMTTVQNTNAP